MGLRIRIGSASDASLVAGLLTDFNREFKAPVPELEVLTARFERVLADPQAVVVIGEENDAAGFALVTLRPTPYYDGPIAQLDELYVQPHFRNRGMGAELLEEAILAVRQRGAGEMHINVDEIDEDARRFYERAGFINIEPGTDYRMLCYLREF